MASRTHMSRADSERVEAQSLQSRLHRDTSACRDDPKGHHHPRSYPPYPCFLCRNAGNECEPPIGRPYFWCPSFNPPRFTLLPEPSAEKSRRRSGPRLLRCRPTSSNSSSSSRVSRSDPRAVRCVRRPVRNASFPPPRRVRLPARDRLVRCRMLLSFRRALPSSPIARSVSSSSPRPRDVLRPPPVRRRDRDVSLPFLLLRDVEPPPLSRPRDLDESGAFLRRSEGLSSS